MTIADYLPKAQEALAGDQDQWLLHVKTDVDYTINADGSVKRDGGTFLYSRAHGSIAELVTDGEEVIDIKPGGEMPWRIVSKLQEAMK